MTSSELVAGPNPFVGPRPLETGQSIFGRERETEELYYLLSAERIVLLHSPSGAGKSSLIRAGLIPRLQQRFDVRGPTRVNTPMPDGLEANRYVISANLGFEQGLPESRRRDERVISRMTLAEYAANRPRRRAAPQNVVLIFDQFEEILTTDLLALEAKREFFRQLGELLQDPNVWALFALREDYLAPLDLFANQVPTHLKNRFRVDLLGRDAAQAAMQGTAQEGRRRFETEAVEQLARDLATMQVQQPDGRFEQQVGPNVEPLHLQVACRGLWDRMPAEDLSIDVSDIESFGDVTQALARYYEDVVGALTMEQRAVREWVSEKLMTPNGIRAQVLKGAGSSEGLDNALITALVDAHLVRSEQRAGAVWFELAHDRLVEPIRKNNERWFDEHLSSVQKNAAMWEVQDRPPGLLLLGDSLAEAQIWAADRRSLTDVEHQYLAASLERQAAVDRELRQERRLRRLAVISSAVGMLALAAGAYAWVLGTEAVEQRQQALLATRQALIAKEEALNQKSRADDLARKLEAQLRIAESPTASHARKPPENTAPVRALTAPELVAIMPRIREVDRATYARLLDVAMAEFAINTPLRQAHFLGQVAFETVDLRYLQEAWNPDAISWQLRYESRRDLGNTEPGDGKRYLGRGVFQLVGRANYKKYGDALGLDLVGNPELAARPDVAMRTGAIFWKLAGLNDLADADDVRGITRRIAGKLDELDARTRDVERAKATLGVTPRKNSACC